LVLAKVLVQILGNKSHKNKVFGPMLVPPIRTAKPNKQGLIGTFPKTEPMQEVSVVPLSLVVCESDGPGSWAPPLPWLTLQQKEYEALTNMAG